MISLAYSRISLKDVCLKLHLDSEEDTEYIVAKAIRDGVIDAEVDHAQGWMKSREAGNVYETDEPQKAFQQRIEFCMNLHNESVKAMRYPLNANKPGKHRLSLLSASLFAPVLISLTRDDSQPPKIRNWRGRESWTSRPPWRKPPRMTIWTCDRAGRSVRRDASL